MAENLYSGEKLLVHRERVKGWLEGIGRIRCPTPEGEIMDNDDLLAAFVVLVIVLLIYACAVDLRGAWLP